MISTLIALPYELARLPLAIVDNGLPDRLPETSGPCVTLDRVIGSSDKLAGALLGNRDIAKRGADRIERSASSRQAVQQRNAAQKKVASALKEATLPRRTASRRPRPRP